MRSASLVVGLPNHALNVESIQENGLLTSYATGKMLAVWLHTTSKTPWAILHVSSRKRVAAEDITVFEVNVPRRWLKRAGKTGLWYCRQDIPKECIVRVVPIEETAASPLP